MRVPVEIPSALADKCTELRRLVQIPEHGHPSPDPPASLSPVATPPFPGQIILPFDLHRDPSESGKSANQRLLHQILPGTHRIDYDGRVLVYHLDQLPPKPWPKKIAGLPCYLTTDPNDLGPMIPKWYFSRSRIDVAAALDLRDNEAAANTVFDLVREFFDKAEISITEIQYWDNYIIIILEDELEKDEALQAAPRTVARCTCFYLFESMMARPDKLPARRIREASLTTIDDNRYETLRPGVMLSSGQHPEDGTEFLTSSGVLVRDDLGFHYMTVAARGFPGSPFDGKVYHPRGSGVVIGELIQELGHTDVALVKLKQGIHFINETFESTVIPGPSSQLTGFVRADETRIGDPIFLESPFSGFLEGRNGPRSFVRIPADDPHQTEQTWIRCRWTYMGQDANQMLVDGVCGSAIWNEDKKVLGFFRYAPSSGAFQDWCLTASANHLLDKGYTIVS